MPEVQRYNLQDDAASTTIVAAVGSNGALVGGSNTADITTTGPGGSFPKALHFDGTDDYINSADVTFAANAAGTIACWVKLDTLGGALCASGGGGATDDAIHLQQTQAVVRVSDATDTLTWNSNIAVDTWYHFVFTRGVTGGVWKAWINGVAQTDTRVGSAADFIITAIGNATAGTGVTILDGSVAGWVVRDDEADQTIVDALYAEGVSAGYVDNVRHIRNCIGGGVL
jgi:hypothetical protein